MPLKMPEVFFCTVTSIVGCSSIFLICQALGPSILQLFAGVNNQLPLTRGLLFLMQMSWTGWFLFFATWVVSTVFVFVQKIYASNR
jgi:hypothetical protein